MNILDLPLDIILKIEELLPVNDLCQWRVVRYFEWNFGHLYRYGFHKLRERMNAKRQRMRCIQCNHCCITEIEWVNGLRRAYVPWCTIHIDPTILNGIELYCVGGLDVNGRSLLF